MIIYYLIKMHIQVFKAAVYMYIGGVVLALSIKKYTKSFLLSFLFLEKLEKEKNEFAVV